MPRKTSVVGYQWMTTENINTTTYCNWGKIPDGSTDIGVIGVSGVIGAGVIGFKGKGDIPLWNDDVDCTLGG